MENMDKTTTPVDEIKDTEVVTKDTEAKNEGSKNRTKIFAIAGVATVVALGALTAGVIGANNTARATYTQEYNSAVQVDGKLTKAIEQAENVAKTDPNSVLDSKVLDTLNATIKSATKDKGVTDFGKNEIFFIGLNSATDKVKADKAQAQSDMNALSKATTAVQASVEAKKLDTAKNDLQASIDNGTNVLNSTDGKVQDNATRDTLKSALEAGSTEKANTKASVDSLTAKKNDIDNAINSVNASVQAKEQAEAQAKAQAQAQSRSTTSGRTSQRSYSGSSSQRSYSGSSSQRSYSGSSSRSGGSASSNNGGATSQSEMDRIIAEAYANVKPSTPEQQRALV